MTNPLTREQIQEGLAGHGIPYDARDTNASCPVCNGLLTLTITQNGAGPNINCSNGCAPLEITGAIRAGRHKIAGTTLPYNPLQLVRDRLTLPQIERIIKHGKLGNTYEMILADGRIIDLGNAATIISQPRLRARLLPQVRNLPPRIKNADEWEALVVAIEQAAEERDNVDSEAEETRGWIAGYLRSSRSDRLDVNDAGALYARIAHNSSDRDQPFWDHENRLHLRLEPFTFWLNRQAGARPTRPELTLRLSHGLGFEPRKLAARSGGHVKTMRVWVSPAGFEADT